MIMIKFCAQKHDYNKTVGIKFPKTLWPGNNIGCRDIESP